MPNKILNRDYELKCDYCKQIIKTKTSTSFACTACGHGRVRLRRPKKYCDTCGSPIYDNADSARRVTCGDCVQRRLFYFSNEIKELGRIVREARKAKGWSQRMFALAMECSKSLVDMVEKAERKPTPKMRKFMLSVSSTK